ncbi:MAG: T9SS type A sorting domain-containing protein, partial [Bacteroidota bacterium]
QINPDGHDNHVGAWSADVYYGDMDGNWTDATINNTTASQARNHNVPGDGKFDQSTVPSDVELMVGRVDFHSLPAFDETEEELLRVYLQKNHAFKHRQFVPVRRGLIENNFGSFAEAFGQNGLKNFVPAVGSDSTFYRDFHQLRENSYLLSYGCGGGNYTGAGGISNTNNFSNDSLQGVFTMLFGSYFGDWDSNNNFLRSALATGTILSNAWAGRPNWSFHPMALGFSNGYCARLTQNNPGFSYVPGFGNRQIHIALLGDPTLRLFMVEPVGALSISENTGEVNLSWTAPQEDVVGYHVYRKSFDDWERITDAPVTATSYVDACQDMGSHQYMVRALQLEQTASGSYYQLSLGVTDSITTQTDLSVTADFTITDLNNGSLQINDQSLGATSYEWSLSNGDSSTDPNPFFEDVLAGDLDITLVVSNGCNSDTLTKSLTITNTEDILTAPIVRVFPNPATDILQLEHYFQQSNIRVELWSVDGRMLRTVHQPDAVSSWSVKDLPTGSYYLQWWDGNVLLVEQTVVKQ